MIAFVTGATGFLGSHLVERLVERGDDVRCLVRDPKLPRWLEAVAPRVRLVAGDLELGDALDEGIARADVVFHLAGLTKAESADEYRRVNEDGTRRVLDACERRGDGLRRVVVASSIAAVGPAPPHEEIVEGQACAPLTLYGTSKLEGERAALERRDRLPVAVVRPSAVVGPRDVDALGLFKMVRRRLRPVDARIVNFVFVKDVVEALVLAAERAEADGEVFHVGGENLTLTACGRALARALGVRALPCWVPRPFFFAVASMSEVVARWSGRRTILNRDKAREFTASWAVSSEKARRLLGWRPRTDLEAAARETAAWYRARGWL